MPFMPAQPIVVSLLPQPVALQPVRPALLPQVVVKGGGEAVALSAKAGAAPENIVAARQARLITTAIANLFFIDIPLPPLCYTQNACFEDSGIM